MRRVVCYDPETDQEVGDYTAISQALAESQRLLAEEFRDRAEAEQRAQADAQARAADARALAEALARIRELEAQAELKRPRRRGS